MHRNWMLLILTVEIWTTVICKDYYSIVAPGTIKSNRNYSICVTLHEAEGPCTIRVGILGTPVLNISEELTLQPFQTKTIEFLLPKLSKEYKYNLTAEGVGRVHFKNTTQLNVVEQDSLKIYMQTDKGVYNPGNLVQFRVVVLNEHIKPIKLVEPIKIQILDGAENRVKQYKDIRLIKGCFSENFTLSEQPILGNWTIVVSISGRYALSQRKTFAVEQYVLPKFSVHVDTVNDFVLEDEVLRASVYGKYTYGKYLEGDVEALLVNHHTSEILLKQSLPIKDFKADVEFNVTGLMISDSPSISIEATLIEKYTDVSLTTTQIINLHKQRYQIVIPENEIEFRNNKPYMIKAIVQYINGTLVEDHKTPVYMQHGAKHYESFLDDNGVAKFTFDSYGERENIFKFKTASTVLPNIAVGYNKDTKEKITLCSLQLKKGKLQLGSVVEIDVSSNSSLRYFIYTIIGHSNIIYKEYVQLMENQKSYTLKIIPTIEMMPRSYVHVHYIENGNFRYCEIELKFPKEFENQISISTLTSTVKPGQEVTLNIKAQTESRVGLFAVDLSVVLLNSDFNFKKEDIFAELLSDESYTPEGLVMIGQQSGLLILTNAHLLYDYPKFHIIDFHNSDWGHTTVSDSRKLLWDSDAYTPTRSKFPETWIFKDFDVIDANTELSLNVPDTITTWLVTAFSVNENTGFGMMEESLNITVFQSFFISTNLPYSIKRGETIAIPVTIFNYYEQNLSTEIMMNHTEGEFQFMNNDNTILNVTNMTKYINVPANSGKSVSFVIAAQKVGDINIQLRAKNDLTSDAIHQILKVEPEGIIESHNQDVYLNLYGGQNIKSYLRAEIPQDIIPASEYLRLSLGGDVLVTTMEYLNDLIQLPTGCGEQNMINFVPNILVLDYLKVIGKLKIYPDLVVKATKFIEIGYQRQLTYADKSGGYSVFGRPYTESSWLTAYVIRFFIKALKYVAVESEVIEGGFNYLVNQQQNDGAFSHTGYLFYPAHQNKYGFTAFVLMSFLENRKYRNKYNQVIQKGLQFLTSNINNVNDTYALSIMACTFQMAKKTEEATVILNKLQTKAREADNQKWWSENDNQRSNDVEITSYILMALLDSSQVDIFPIFRWLIGQRNAKGGYKTSQDTVVGLQALVKFVKKYGNSDDTLLKVNYTARDQQGNEVTQGLFGVDPDNAFILQQHELPKSTRSINFEVVGNGNSLLQLSYHYYKKTQNQQVDVDLISQTSLQNPLLNARLINEEQSNSTQAPQQPSGEREQSFIITPLAKMSAANKLNLEVCFKYQPKDILKYQKTNMVILEINLPSGFVAYTDNTEDLLEEDVVTRVELKNLDSTILIYFDHLQAKNEHCIHTEGDKVHDVQMLQPSIIVMYDYYNGNLRDTVSYQIQS